MSSLRQSAKMLLRKSPPLFRLTANVIAPVNRGQRIKAAGRTIAYDVRTRALGKPTTARIGRKSKIVSYQGETNSPHAVYRNPPNTPEMYVWRNHLRAGDTFMDVGTNVGIYTLFAIDCGARVIGVEPDPASQKRLRENLALNGYAAEIHDVALSTEPGTMRLTQGLDSNNHLVIDGSGEGVEVEVRTLDSVLGDRHIAGLKIDVEGAERLVIEGARQALTEHRIDLIQMEWSDVRSRELLGEVRGVTSDILADAGYVFYRPDKTGRLHKIVGDVIPGRDIFAAPADLPIDHLT